MHQDHHVQAQRNLYVQVARQTAINLTTINYTEVDADIKRVLDSRPAAFTMNSRTVRNLRRGRQEGAVEIRRHHRRGGAADLNERPSASARRGVGQDINGGRRQTKSRADADALTVDKTGESAKVECRVRAMSSRTALTVEEDTAMSDDNDPVAEESSPETLPRATTGREADAREEGTRPTRRRPSRAPVLRAWCAGRGSSCVGVDPGSGRRLSEMARRHSAGIHAAAERSIRAASDSTIAILSFKPETVDKKI